MLYAIDFQSAACWERGEARAADRGKHAKNTDMSESADGRRARTVLRGIGLFAFDMNGPLWNKGMDPMPMRSLARACRRFFMAGALCRDDNDRRSSPSARREDGAGGRQALRKSTAIWSTPFVWEHDGTTEIVTTGSKEVRAYDLNGKPTWHPRA